MMNKHEGSSFDSFLEEEGLLEDVESLANKKVTASYEQANVLTKENLSETDQFE